MRKMTMMLMLSVAVLLVAATAQAAVVNVDIQNLSLTASGRAAAPDAAGNTLWNAMGSSATNLTASDGSATTIDVSLSGAQGFTNQPGPNNLVKDRIYEHRTYDDDVFTFTISGLANSTSYDIYLYGAYDSRTSIVNFATDFTIGGVTKTAQALTSEPTTLDGTGWIENDHYVKFSVTSSSSGVITGTVSNHDDNDPNTTGDYGILSGMQIVPEPATMSLLGIGGLLALVRRRRK